jgi:hypothetical protein
MPRAGHVCWLHCLAGFFAPTDNIVYNGFLLVIINSLFVFFFSVFTLAMFVFFPIVILLFAVIGLVVWYHFGAHIHKVDKGNQVLNALFSVLIGVAPFLFVAITYQVVPLFGPSASALLAIYGVILMSVMASIIMPIMVVIGSLSSVMFEK